MVHILHKSIYYFTAFFAPLLQGYCASTLNMDLNVGCHVRSTDLRLCYQQWKASIKQLPTYYAAVK